MLISDIVYATPESSDKQSGMPRSTLDVYAPQEPTENTPMLIFFADSVDFYSSSARVCFPPLLTFIRGKSLFRRLFST